MSSSLVGVRLRVLLTATLAAALTLAPSPTSTTAIPSKCPLRCSCTSNLSCSDLGEQSRVMDFSSVVASAFSYLQFFGRTKIRTIQTRAFSGLRVQRLRLDSLGVRDIESGAFLGVSDLTDVNVSHNHISGSVDSGMFAADTALSSLDISDNDIESLSSHVFALAGGSSIRELRLADNRLMVLPDLAFANLTGLEHLDLSGNRLTNLTQPLFDELFSLRRLLLANNRLSSLHPTQFNYLQHLDQLALENNELSSLPASVFSQLSSLRTLTLQGNRLTAVYSNVFPTIYSNLTTLNLDRNRFADLAQIGISGISSLETLTLAANRLTTIPTGYFDGLSSVKHLDLSRNNISSVLNESSFKGLTSLMSLNLSSSNIARISARTFGSSIRTLDLSKNDHLQDIDSDFLENAVNLTDLYMRSSDLSYETYGRNVLDSLENLDLYDNSIRYVNFRLFDYFPSLRRVDLSKNRINAISFSNSHNASLVSHVTVDDNRFSEMPVDVMSKLLNLRDLSLAHNSIEKVPILQSQSVVVLNLTGNIVSDIVDGAFNSTPNIRELYLGQNRLTSIRSSMFSDLKSLDHLDLSDNLISTIDVGSFQSLQRLTYLSLHGNKLASIAPGTFIGLYRINTLVLSANRLVSDVTEGLGQLDSLQYLILDNNHIISFNISYFFQFKSAPHWISLRRNRISELQLGQGWFSFRPTFLDLGENQITDDIFRSLQHLSYLQTLKLDGNNIRSVPTVGAFNGSLTELDLSNNALNDSSLTTIVQLRRLRQLRLDGNSISNLSTVDWGFLASSLSVLSLSNNRLTSLDQIGKLWSLTHLNVDNNLIESIPDAAFQPLYELEVLSMRGNRLTTIEQSTLNGLEQKCTQLDLSSNYIESVHPDSFHRLKNIRRLNLSNNTIKELVLPPTMDQLTELLLSNNQLTKFPGGLYNMRSINVLSLHNNLIDSMPSFDISSESGVRVVDLSHNRLRIVDQVHFVGSLNVVNISGNELTDIDADVLADATFISELSLSSNALGRLPVAVTLAVDRIARLYADRCSLTSLDNWVVSSPTTRLVELSLSANRLTVLPSSVIATVSSSLEHLDVRGNLLSTLDSEIYFSRSFPGDLSRLSLTGNPWLCDCQLAWLQYAYVEIDNATCWTPSTTTGQQVRCYDVDDCNLYYEAMYTDTCEEAIPPTGLRISKQ